MAETFTKLFGSIVASTVWQEPAGTRLTWITMLAMADRKGIVEASIPGLANIANVTVEECERAIESFMAPDKWSRTPDNEGRRIEAVYGGWRLLNHALYRAKADSEERLEYKRNWDREKRGKPSDKKPTASDTIPTGSDDLNNDRPQPTQAEAEAELLKQDQEHAQPAALLPEAPPKAPRKAKGTSERFLEFWLVYPVKKGKADAERHWKAMGLDPIADQLIAHVRMMEVKDCYWQQQIIPYGSTYIHGKRWEDEPSAAPIEGKPPAPAPAAETFGAAAALKASESPMEHKLGYARQCYDRGDFGTGMEGRNAYLEKCREIRAGFGAA